MVQEFVDKWEKNKHVLRASFYQHPGDYDTIVKLVVEIIINGGSDGYESYDTSKMTVIDDGNYQGTRIFIIPEKTYQPCVSDYIMTYEYYGSCSGCDTLQSIRGYEDEVTEQQTNDYMTLALHLLQRMKMLGE